MTNKIRAKILIVEGEMSLAMLLVSALSHVGCDVSFARTGKRAMELATECKFDLITLNAELPDSSGFEICSELKQRHISYKTPVIFVFAQTNELYEQEAKRRGAADYVAKPIDVTDFIYRAIYHAKVKAVENETVRTGEYVA